MDKEILKSRLEEEEERCIARLAELDPSTNEYRNCAYAAQHLNDWRYSYRFCEYDPPLTPLPNNLVEGPTNPAPEPEPAPEPAPGQTPAPTPDEPILSKSEVRAALSTARNQKGVDVSALWAPFGATSFNDVDPKDYRALMAALEKELEGK